MTRRRTLGLGAVVLLVALVVVLLVVRPGGRRPSTAPSPSTSATSATRVTSTGLVVDVRRLSVEDLTVTLPGQPFSCVGPLPTPPYGFAGYESCSATVHEDYDGEGGTWVAQVGVVLLDGRTGDPDHLGASAGRAFRTLFHAFFSADDSPRLTQESAAPVAVHGRSGRAYRHQARVTVDREDLDTTSDLLTVEAVRLRDGRVAAVWSDLPRDADGDLLRAAVVAQLSTTLG